MKLVNSVFKFNDKKWYEKNDDKKNNYIFVFQ